MPSEHLSKRKNWQKIANLGGTGKEDVVFSILKALFIGNKICEVVKERILIYENGRGVKPDCMIRNTNNGKMILIEVKNQGKSGNAHERLCRNYMPGIQNELEKQCGFRYPFFTICTNGLATDPHKSQEITKWFDSDELKDRLFLFKDKNKPETIINYFKKIVLKYLDYEI